MRADEASTTGNRGPYAKSVRTRQVILDAAFDVFSTSGYRSGSLHDVAQRAQMSDAGILHHFSNKSELLIAVLAHRDELARGTFLFDPQTGRRALEELVALARYNEDIPGVVELFCTLSAESIAPDHPAHEYFRNRYEAITGMVGETLEIIRQRGELRDDIDVQSAAAQTVAVWDGIQIQWLLNRSSVDMAAELRRLLNFYLVDSLSIPATPQ